MAQNSCKKCEIDTLSRELVMVFQWQINGRLIGSSRRKEEITPAYHVQQQMY